MILFFDTETTGFPHKHKPVDHPDQPHIVQVAAILAEPDGTVRGGMNIIIDPGVESGIRIPSAAAAIHGLDEEKCWRFGSHPFGALIQLGFLWHRADEVVGHNIDYDFEMLDIALSRQGDDIQTLRNVIDISKPRFCTMKSTTDICRIPSPRGGYKWPKLGEAYKHFFGEELVGAHDAMNDVRASMRIYFHLKNGGGAAPVAALKPGEW